MKKILLCSLLFLLGFSLFAQQRTVVGKVLDAATQTPLPNATISIAGQFQDAKLADENGDFSITLTGKQTLVLSYTGYQAATIEVGENQTSITINLTKAVAGLDEVVVIGYGTQKRKDITSSISSLNEKQISEVPSGTINMAMQGRIPGLQINSGGYEPGAGTTARIRGINSINVNNGPLYVVDGVIVTGDLREINPSDIESIDVLKDASAAAIYGARAAEGVIIITTKKAKIGMAQINYNGYYGVQNVVKPFNYINGQQYEKLRRQAMYEGTGNIMFLNDTTTDRRFDKQIFSMLELNTIAEGKTYDWPSQILQNGRIQSHTISMSSGNDKNRMYISGNYFDQDGIIKNSNQKRYSLNFNGESQLTSKIKAFLKTNISHLNYKMLDKQTYYNALTTSPLIPYADNSGNPTVVEYPNLGYQYIINNPMILIANPTLKKEDRLMGSLGLTYDIVKDFVFRTAFNADILNSQTMLYAPRNINYKNSYTKNGYGSIEDWGYRDYTTENTLSYDFKAGSNHSFNAMAGFVFENRRQTWNFMEGWTFPTDKTTYKDMSAATEKQIYSDFFNWSVVSGIGRVIYKFKDRYIFNATVRRDGASYFGENYRYGTFPSFSAAWRLIDEPFMNAVKLKGAISDAKLRLSYGIIGNYNRDYTAVYSKMNIAKYPFDGNNLVTGYQINTDRLANKDLQWEAQHQSNIGFDLGLFSNRLNFTVDYYNKNIKNLLMPLDLSPSSGWNAKIINVAEMNTRGIDIGIKAEIIKTNNFTWQSEFNWSTYKSKVTKLLPGRDSLNINLQVGEAPNSIIYGYVYDGLYQSGTSDSTIMKALSIKPGSVKVVDFNKDNKLNDLDQRILGRTTPKAWGGFWNYFNYKGLSLTVFSTYMYGHNIFNKAYQDYMYPDGSRVVRVEAMNYWTEKLTYVDKQGQTHVFTEENKNTDVPRPNSWGESFKGLPNGTSSFAVQKGDFFRIRSITLGYDFKSKILEKARLRSLNVYMQFLEPFIFTGYKGVDPEISQMPNGGSWSSSAESNYDLYPRYRTTLVGVKIGF